MSLTEAANAIVAEMDVQHVNSVKVVKDRLIEHIKGKRPINGDQWQRAIQVSKLKP